MAGSTAKTVKKLIALINMPMTFIDHFIIKLVVTLVFFLFTGMVEKYQC